MSRESPRPAQADRALGDESVDNEREGVVDSDREALGESPEESPEDIPGGAADEGETARTHRLRDSGAALRGASADAFRGASGAAFRKVEEAAPPSIATRIRSFRERIRHRRALDTAWRVGVFALGMTLLILGLIMFVVPGPGFATIILGLVILGSEFAWATRVLDPVKAAARRAAQAATDPRRRRRNLTLAAILGVAVGVFVAWYLLRFGLTLDPVWALVAEVQAWFVGLFD